MAVGVGLACRMSDPENVGGEEKLGMVERY